MKAKHENKLKRLGQQTKGTTLTYGIVDEKQERRVLRWIDEQRMLQPTFHVIRTDRRGVNASEGERADGHRMEHRGATKRQRQRPNIPMY